MGKAPLSGGRRRRALLPLLLLLAGLAPAAAAEEEKEGPDDAVLERIADLHRRAGGIRLDGSPREWGPFPSFEDRDPTPVRDRSLDLRSLAIAPLDDDLLVTFSTAGFPSRRKLAFSLDVDFLGRSAPDASITFGAEGGAVVRLFPEAGKAAFLKDVPVRVRASEAVELWVPLAPLAAALGEAGARWSRGDRRPFVRVQVFSHGTGFTGIVDEGPAAASFRLTDPPPVLDPPPAPGEEPRRFLLMPLTGHWFVRQGVDGLWSHRGLNAYDLSLVDHALSSTAKPGSRKLEEYYAFGRPVFAPEKGSVVFDSVQGEDGTPLERGAGKDSGNTLVLRFADGLRLTLGHLRHGSLAVARAAEFRLGDPLAEVGNSGDSGAPHLHLSLHERPGEFVGLPLGFRRVRVGLNPGPDDPWARDLAEWPIREGWFVGRQ